MGADIDGIALRGEIQRAKAALLSGLRDSVFVDLAFIGNASALYHWEPALIIDLDVCLFVAAKADAGPWLFDLRRRLVTDFASRNVRFDLRLVRGCFKDAVRAIHQPSLLVHVALFTEASYSECCPLMKWAWRKYPSMVEPSRLLRLAPPRPSARQLLDSIDVFAGELAVGRAPYTEWLLPDLRQIDWTAGDPDPLFAEHCLSGALICARNHARVLGLAQADTLCNRRFVTWYEECVLRTRELQKIMEIKNCARNEGYGQPVAAARGLALDYLHKLRERLSAATCAGELGSGIPQMAGPAEGRERSRIGSRT